MISGFFKKDSFNFLAGSVLIAFLWQVIIQIPLTESYGSYDLLGLMAHYSSLVREGFLASDFIYSPSRLGGTPSGPIDMPVYYQLFGVLKLHPILAINLSIILSQTLIYFYSFKFIRWETGGSSLPMAGAWALILAFSPSIAWRIGFGHLNLIWGLLWAMAAVYLVRAVRHSDLTPTGIICSFIVFANALQCVNLAQPIYYAIICFLFYFMFYSKKALRLSGSGLVPLAVCGFSATLYSATNLANIVALTPSLGRFESPKIIYSYVTQTLPDFISSLLYSYKSYPIERDYFLLHETNLAYGFAPLALIALLFQHPRLKLLQLNVALLSFGIILSADIPVISDALLAIVPLAEKFRCPGRFFILTTYLGLITLGLITLKGSDNRLSHRDLAPLLIAFILTLPSFDLNPDLVFAAGVIVTAISSFTVKRVHHLSLVSFLLAAHLVGFREKIPAKRLTLEQYQDEMKLFDHLDLPNRMTEHSSVNLFTSFSLNQSSAYGYSGIDGYIYPTRRFIEFARMFQHDVASGFAFHADSTIPGFDVFARFFNITSEVRKEGESFTRVRLQEAQHFYTPEKAIVLESIRRKDLEDLNLKEEVILEDLPGTDIVRCSVTQLKSSTDKEVVITTETPSTCIVVLPLQYSQFLRARSGERDFPVVPANKIMTAIIVKKFKGEVRLSAKPELGYEIFFKILSALVLIGFIYFHLRQRKNETPSAAQV